MRRIDVEIGARSYAVVIDDGLLAAAADHLHGFARGGRLVVVSDANVWEAWGDTLSAALREGGIATDHIVLPPGEANKSWAALATLTDALVERDVEREDAVIAFGGGVIGDLVGFAAAILKRGCRYVQIPTTLLAQVDSSVGGKTAINIAAGKNIVGAFHQPAAVLIDPATLATLPERELRAGYAEVVKYGLIGDADFFGWCEANGAPLIAGDTRLRAEAIAYCVAAKATIVGADERETKGRRALLNLGHTFGHALEAAAGFSDELLHGEAVAAGMVLAFRFSAERGLCAATDAERVATHLAAVRLPTELASLRLDIDAPRLITLMKHDKKQRDGRLPFILARGIGGAFVDTEVELADVEAFLARQL